MRRLKTLVVIIAFRRFDLAGEIRFSWFLQTILVKKPTASMIFSDYFLQKYMKESLSLLHSTTTIMSTDMVSFSQGEVCMYFHITLLKSVLFERGRR